MQSPELSLDYFELFGLNPVFDIDPILLNAAQQRLQASHHPDRHVGSNEQDKRLSVQIASRVNQAYETLRDPVKRSRYLLEINGATLPDDSATTAEKPAARGRMHWREAKRSKPGSSSERRDWRGNS
jgi:molecular chaperone HscB